MSGVENVVAADFARLREARRSPGQGGPYRDASGGEFDDPLEFLRAQLRVDVVGAVKLGRSHDLLYRGGGRIKLGSAADVLAPGKLRAAMLDHQVVVPRFKGDQIDEIARALAAVVEVLDPDAEEEATRAWLAEYARDRVIGPVEVKDAAALKEAAAYTASNVPALFRGTDDRLYLKVDPFVVYVTKTLGRTTREDMTTRLRRLGFEQYRIDERLPGGGKVRARTWCSPPGFDPLEDG